MRYLSALVLLVACVGPNTPESVVAPPTQVQATTIAPEAFEANPQVPSVMLVPRQLISMARVVRARAEIRTAPGTEYSIKDSFFKESELVLVLQKSDVWTKVMAIDAPIDGWVHQQTLRPYSPDTETQLINSARLPRAFAVTNVQSILEYPSLRPLKVSIPKGTIFVCLSRRGKQKIIYLAQTNSVAVVNESEFQ